MSGAPEVRETHVSLLFFVGDHVYKLKKPVRFGFVDLTTRAERERICHREVELNRRLAPDVYLGVLDVTDDRGAPLDHLVRMRRLPDEQRLSALVRQESDVAACLRQVARVVAAFHADAQTSAEIAAHGRPDAVRALWRESLAEMEPFVGPVLDPEVFGRVRSGAERYLDGRASLFEGRVADGRVRDGHGDLLAEDIFCLPDGPRVLDCIEFNDRFRYADVLADAAFLAMDLERLGAPDDARRFLAWYREFSGETHPDSLAHHYIAYRATVRSKVACLSDAPQDAQELLSLADAHLERARVRLVMVGGLPGTGKTTLATSICERTGWTLLRSDEVRKELAGLSHAEHAPAEFGKGIYTEDMTNATYRELLARARRLLEGGHSVVCDASWLRAAARRAATEASLETVSDLVELRCDVASDVAAERRASRAERRDDASDADERVARAMAVRMDPWPGATVVTTDADADACAERALRSIGAAS